MTFRPQHYRCRLVDADYGPKGVMQIDSILTDLVVKREGMPRLSESILRLAQAEYEVQYQGQDYERIQERGGLSVLEVIRLLADYVERLGGTPSEPREKLT